MSEETIFDKLENSSGLLETIIEQSGDGISFVDSEGNYVFANRAFYQMLGYEESQQKNIRWQDITHPDDIEFSQKIIDSVFAGEKNSTRFTKRYIHRDGSAVWGEIDITLRRDKKGNPLYLMTVVTDITEKREKEETLRKSERRYRSLFENMLNGYAYCKMIFNNNNDPIDFIYLDVNGAFEKLTGLKDVKGKKVTEIIPGIAEIDPEILNIYGRVALCGEPETFEFYLESFSMWFSVSAYSPEKGYFVAIFDVITERKLAEIEREKNIQMLEIINEETDLRELMKSLLDFMQDLSGCDAVGIRLREGDDFPYFQTSGFSNDFIVSETHLCTRNLQGQRELDEVGNPVLECMCGNIICGRFDPSKPFFTDFGSFISNNTSGLLESTTEEDRQARTRNRCNGEGYESVFLVPLRTGGETFGLMQFNSYNTDHFSEQFVAQIERLARSVAAALAQRKAEESLRISEEKYRVLFDTFPLGITISDQSGKIVEINNAAENLLGISREEHLSRAIDSPEWEIIDSAGNPMGSRDYAGIRAFSENRVIEDVEMGVIRPDGKTVWLSVTAAPLQLKNYGVVITYGDISARRQAEQDYQILFQEMIDGFALHEIICDDQGTPVDYRFLAVNPAFERMTGLKAEQITGKTVLDVLPGTEKHWIETYGKVAITGEPVHFENESAELGKFFEVTAYRAALNQFACIFVDITDRKKAELALIESEKRWRNVLVNTPQIGVSLNPKGEIIFANDHFLRLTGWNRDEVMGQNWFEMFIPENIREEVGNVFKTVMKQEDTLGFSVYENKILDKKGNLLDIAWSNVLTKDVNGNIVDTTSLGVDLSEQKRAEELLKKSEAKYRTMMEALKDPVYISSADHKILYMNKAMIERVGENAIGEKCYKILHGTDSKCAWCDSDKTFQNGYSEKNIVSPRDNRSFNISSSIFVDEDGSISKVSLLRDMTEFKALQEHLQQTQKIEGIGTLAGGIAHDFNNILSPIMLHTEMVMDDLPPDNPLQHDMREIFKAGRRARDLVQQILTFARKKTEEKIVLRASIVVKEAIKFLRSTIPAIIDINYYPKAKQDTIKADPTQLNQIIMNLGINAAHAMRDKGGVMEIILDNAAILETSGGFANLKPGQYLKISVKDSGTGIPPNIIDRIFEPYYTTKMQGEGTGLGLATVHGIVKSSGGDIFVESKTGEGTTFHVYMPLVIDYAPAIEKMNIKIPGGNERILFVDDEQASVTTMEKMLKRLGYIVTSNISSIEALEIFRKDPDAFDLVITDMSMPNMTGKDLTRNIKALRKDLPIILCTGFSDQINEIEARKQGINAFIMKPYVRNEIANTIREVLEQVS